MMKLIKVMIHMRFLLIMILIMSSGCATTGKNPIITNVENQKKLNKHLNKGIKYYQDGRLKKAGAEFNKFFTALNINARIEFDDIMDKEAYKELIVKEYIDRLEPKLIARSVSIQSLFTQGMTLYEAGKFKNAVEYFVKVLVLDHRHTEAMEYINLANAEISRIEEARERERLKEEEKRKKEEERKKIKEYYKKGMAFYNKKDFEKARVEFGKVLGINPEYKKAKEYYDKISIKLFDKARKYYKDGLELYGAGDIEQAINLWTKALELAPDYQEAQKALERASARFNR